MSDALQPEAIPIPPRYWWLKRIAITAGILLVALIALRLWWGYEAHRRLQAEINRLIAAGEPIFPADFDSGGTVPDEENAVVALDEAVAALGHLDEDELEAFDVAWTSGVNNENEEIIQTILFKNEIALSLVRDARMRKFIEWKVQIRSPAFNATLPPFDEYRRLIKLARLNAHYRLHVGDHAEVIPAIQDTRNIAAILYERVTLMNQLLGWTADYLNAQTIESILTRLRFQGDDDKNAHEITGVANRADLEEILRDFLNFPISKEGMINALRSERMMQLDIINQAMLGIGTSVSSILSFAGVVALPDVLYSFVVSPLYELDAVRGMELNQIQANFLANNDWSSKQRLDAELEGLTTDQLRVVHPLSSIILPSVQRSATLYFRLQAIQQMAATAIAIRLYQLDHGRLPAMLDDLIPDYVRILPLDPFADKKSFRYRPDADPPYLYSVYENGQDDSGTYKFNERGAVDYQSLDLPFFLDVHPEIERRKMLYYLEQTQDDQPDEEDGAGEKEQNQSSGEKVK